MASKRHRRQLSCTTKKRFPTEAEAQQHCAVILHVYGSRQTPYPCDWGTHWHVTAGYQPGLHLHKSRGKGRVYRGTW